jgi:hypothetical protein
MFPAPSIGGMIRAKEASRRHRIDELIRVFMIGCKKTHRKAARSSISIRAYADVSVVASNSFWERYNESGDICLKAPPYQNERE